VPQNFIACDRDQAFLLPPSLLEWVPEDHLVWTILGAVAELDLSAIYAVYRPDGHGRPAYEPSMMVALLLYAYAKGNRSSREIERRCREDVAYVVITARRAPDHSTLAEFRRRHERALADLFSGVLGLCRKVGLVKVGLIAIDGMNLHANASQHANRDYRRIAAELLEDAERVDREEDERFGKQRRGDELPEQLHTAQGRRDALRQAKRELDAERGVDPVPWTLERLGRKARAGRMSTCHEPVRRTRRSSAARRLS
jgi:transposase